MCQRDKEPCLKAQPRGLGSVLVSCCFPWIEHQDRLWFRAGPADPLSPRLKSPLIANQSDAALPVGVRRSSISATTAASLNMWCLPSLHLSPAFLPCFWTPFFLILQGITNLLVPGLRLKTSLCATSLYFFGEKWECVCNLCVYCKLVLDALWPCDWSNCVLCTVTNCLLKLWFDWSEHW